MEPTTTTAPDAPTPHDPRLASAVATAGAGLAALVALYELFTIGAGLTFQEKQFPGDELQRVGFVAASAIDLRVGLALVVAAVLVAWSRSLGSGRARAVPEGTGLVASPAAPSTSAGGALVLVGAGLATLLALFAVRAQYHLQDLRRTDATTAFHLSQATYLVGAVGAPVLALIVVVRAVYGPGGRR